MARDEVVMAKRHAEYIEADVDASQQGSDAAYYAGENPEKPGSARWMAWENRKRQDAGLPASNDPLGPETIVLKNKNAAFKEVDYQASKPSSSGGR